MNNVKFHPDRVVIRGPKVDGSYVVTFEVGEYEYDNIKELPLLNGKTLIVEVKTDEQ